MTNERFNSNRYWQERHNRFQKNSQGVGNLSLSQEENDEIYVRTREQLSKVLDIIEIGKDAKVLDLGCGIGMLAAPFLSRGLDYTGVDISKTAVELAARTYSSASFHCQDITELDLAGRFDLVFERTVFIHLTDSNMWFGALQVVKQHLESNGVFIIHDNIPIQAEQPAAHVIFRSRSEYGEAFRTLDLKWDYDLSDRVSSVVPSHNMKFVTHA